ncbi:alpha/beta hydrolase [Amycolatopsis sp. AA4]|uniref:alpha/beta fold hydrolase n=1 Tax=Actinomycetes TaxID=1760 RepID=UPI0001B56AB6|nr:MULTISPECIES: alpha/beta hydrolase [Actinomycetes]ATY11267.1 alpha/beta hydrolase [Amycolatopsis sp. AA4]EFL06857.1 predicted protein [Streptomyces sp. AA4]
MTAPEAVRTGTVRSGAADLYYELRGTGPALVFIPGASGDGGVFAAAADHLTAQRTIVTYDRRGRSRSPRPHGWNHTTADEQADDAAALITALATGPANVFGTSSGATIGLNLALRHPGLVRRAVLHEPPKIGVLPERDDLLAQLRARMDAACARGGPREAMADFSGWLTGRRRESGADLDERVLGSADVWLSHELGVVDRYDPPDALLPARPGSIVVAVDSEGGTDLHQDLLDHYSRTLHTLADRIGAEFRQLPGAHVPYTTHTEEFTVSLAALLESWHRSRELRTPRGLPGARDPRAVAVLVIAAARRVYARAQNRRTCIP